MTQLHTINRKVFKSKKAAFGALWVALAAQTIWMGAEILRSHASVGGVLYPAIATLAFGALAVTGGLADDLPDRVIAMPIGPLRLFSRQAIQGCTCGSEPFLIFMNRL
jgi:hypothetical protein